jgi:filamentous hemagglutinin family protein
MNLKFRLRPFFAWYLCVSFGFNTMFSQQLPSGATFQAGNVKIEQHNSSLHIHQSTPRAVIDWHSFNVGKGEAVHFMQPSQAAATLNRVTGGGVSQILGQITAPGQVFITNGNGVYFGKSASIDVGSMVASSFDIGTSDFMNGNLIFTSQNGMEGGIINAGDLEAKENGFIALLAPEVRNEGIVFAKKGSVVLASGEMIELQTDSANQLVGVRVKPGKWDALVENKKVIEADGGLVVLSAQAESSLFQGLVKNSGVVQAQGIKKEGGRIMLTAGVGGQVKQKGVLNVSSEVGRGGLVTVEGERIELAENSVIDATGKKGGGNILVGGDWQGGTIEELRVFDDPNAMIQASTVDMKENALIDASASESGDGGTVVLWADIFNLKSKTFVDGTIDAKGGSKSGDGGKVETSGHFLDIDHAKISTVAHNGKTGDWLLDPGHIVITTTGTDGDDGIPGSISGTTNIHPTTISTALGSNNITLATGSGNYDLTVTDGITSTSGRNLTLNAGRNLRVNDSISLGSGNLSLVAGHDMTISANITAGSLDLDATDDITVNSYTLNTSTNNGTINLDANEDLSINGVLSSGTGQVTLDGADSLTLGAPIHSGALSMTTNQNLNINGTINAGSSTISLNANNNLTIAADLTTSNQTATAIRAIAGKNDAAGTATGGDIIISGSPTITVGGTSGRATFFSGDISSSSGLTALIGSGSNNFRYNADENTDFSSGNWLALGNGKYAVYRDQPAVTLSTISRVYGADLNLAAITVSSGGVNGDTLDLSS